MSTSHLDRKEIKRPDAFLETAGTLVDFINNNAKAVVTLIVLLVAAGSGLAVYSNHAAKKGEQAENAFFEARKNLAGELAKAMPTAVPGKEPAAPTYPADWDTKAKDSLEKVEKIASEFSGTRAAFEANLLLGDIFFVRKQPAKATEYFKRAAADATPRAAKATALYALAYAHESLKDYDKAAEAFRSVVSGSDPVLKADALMGLGRALALKGDKSKALDAYNQVIKEFAGTPAAKAAETQVSQLK